MYLIKVISLTVGLVLCLCSTVLSKEGRREVLSEVDSVYNHITVTEEKDVRCMYFGNLRQKPETCIDLSAPDWPVFEYSALMFVGLGLKPKNEDIALIGLGGGYIPLVFRLHLPKVYLDVIEIDPKVAELARRYFQFQETDKIRLKISDGRHYLNSDGKRYDQIWIDVFSGDYIPEHMTTLEFLKIVRTRLKDDGLVVQNVHNDQKLYPSQVATFRSTFQYVYLFKGITSRNSIIVAADRELPDPREFAEDNENLVRRIGPISLVEQMIKYAPNSVIDPMPILTDDFSPANLYLQEKN